MSVLAGGKRCLSKELMNLLNLETLPFWLNLNLITELIEVLVVRDILEVSSSTSYPKQGYHWAINQVSYDFV